MKEMTKTELCRMFGCTMEQLNKQFHANADSLEEMYQKAVRTGKKVNNYTAAELRELADKIRAKANA